MVERKKTGRAKARKGVSLTSHSNNISCPVLYLTCAVHLGQALISLALRPETLVHTSHVSSLHHRGEPLGVLRPLTSDVAGLFLPICCLVDTSVVNTVRALIGQDGGGDDRLWSVQLISPRPTA